VQKGEIIAQQQNTGRQFKNIPETHVFHSWSTFPSELLSPLLSIIFTFTD
jgi:hypothetical protein